MSLDKTKLKTLLVKACKDPSIAVPPNPSDAPYPSSEDDARTRWSKAVADYLKDAKVSGPPTVAPTDSQMSFSGVQDAIKDALAFPTEGSVNAAAETTAKAWKAGIDAITLSASGFYDAPVNINPIVAIDALSPSGQVSTLESELITIFSTFGNATTIEGQMELIANAIDTATNIAFITTCTIQPPVGSPVPGNTLIFG